MLEKIKPMLIIVKKVKNVALINKKNFIKARKTKITRKVTIPKSNR